MSKQDTLKEGAYLPLREVARTNITVEGQDYTVKDASPEVFDTWARQYVEEILNVDTKVWTVFQRWNIINELLKERIVALLPTNGGYKLEAVSEVRSEDFSSELESAQV